MDSARAKSADPHSSNAALRSSRKTKKQPRRDWEKIRKGREEEKKKNDLKEEKESKIDTAMSTATDIAFIAGLKSWYTSKMNQTARVPDTQLVKEDEEDDEYVPQQASNSLFNFDD